MKSLKSSVLILLLISLIAGVSAQAFHPSLEPPVCGDDNKEYLIEEMGESRNSAKNDGDYACTPDPTECFYNATGGSAELYDQTEYADAEEADEEIGRFKQDREYCFDTAETSFGTWWDQDYGDVDGDGSQETCRTNTLYGTRGVRWIDPGYIGSYPNATVGGIDDDWNSYIQDQHDSGVMTGYYESRPWEDSWNLALESPVPTGSNNRTGRPDQERKIDTLGFCAGDDGSEYLVTQRCETGLCETNNSVLGVAGDPNHCVLEGDQVNAVSDAVNNTRSIYGEGELVNIDTGSGTGTMACFGGNWNEEWPISFVRDNVQVPLNYTDRVSFRLINVESETSNFELSLSIPNDDLRAFTTFEKSGTREMTASVPPSSSKTYNLEIRGNKKLSNKEIEIIGSSQDGSLTGSDRTDVSIVNMSDGRTAGRVEERNVPGINWVQLVWLMLTASALYLTVLFRG